MLNFFAKLFNRPAKPPVQSGTLIDNVPAEVRLCHKLTPEMYAHLENSLSRLAVGPDTTELQAGFQLGVAAVLEKLRKGYTVGE